MNEDLSEDDPEIKKNIKVCTVIKNKYVIAHLSQKVSVWSEMKRIIATALCYQTRLLQSVQKKKGINIDDRQTGLVSLEDIQSAERQIINQNKKNVSKMKLKHRRESRG